MVSINVSIDLNIPVILFVILFTTVSCVLFLSQQCSESVVRSHLCHGFLDQPVFAYLLKKPISSSILNKEIYKHQDTTSTTTGAKRLSAVLKIS